MNIYTRLELIDLTGGYPEPGNNWTDFANLSERTPKVIENLGFMTANMVIDAAGFPYPPTFDNCMSKFAKAMDPPLCGEELFIFQRAARTAIEDRESIVQPASFEV